MVWRVFLAQSILSPQRVNLVKPVHLGQRPCKRLPRLHVHHVMLVNTGNQVLIPLPSVVMPLLVRMSLNPVQLMPPSVKQANMPQALVFLRVWHAEQATIPLLVPRFVFSVPVADSLRPNPVNAVHVLSVGTQRPAQVNVLSARQARLEVLSLMGLMVFFCLDVSIAQLVHIAAIQDQNPVLNVPQGLMLIPHGHQPVECVNLVRHQPLSARSNALPVHLGSICPQKVVRSLPVWIVKQDGTHCPQGCHAVTHVAQVQHDCLVN